MVKKIAEKFNRLSRVHHRHRQQTDRQQTDGIATASSNREREFTFAKNEKMILPVCTLTIGYDLLSNFIIYFFQLSLCDVATVYFKKPL